jgi:hypothetical protein
MRSEKWAVSPNCLEADVLDRTFGSITGEQLGEKIGTLDKADKPASRRNSRRFMISPPIAVFCE